MSNTNGTIEMAGNLGTYVDDQNVISFQVGASVSMDEYDENFTRVKNDIYVPRFMDVNGYHVYSRGTDNRSCEHIERDIKRNRLLPRLIDKQVKFLYGKGLLPYRERVVEGKVVRVWEQVDELTQWLESWEDNGIEHSHVDFSLASIKRYYYFRDFFVKLRMSAGKAIGRAPIAGLELLENKNCRLATMKEDVVNETVLYKDFRYVMHGEWNKGGSKFKVYPLFRMNEFEQYQYAAVSHHRESSVGDFYGLNETHEGVKTFLKTSNEIPTYIDSFLENSLAAKIHVIIPNEWVESKRKQIRAICEENKRRKKDDMTLLTYNGIDVGTDYRESLTIKFMSEELRRLSAYLSGAKNQGKAYASFSFATGKDGQEQRWKIETIDLKYKEYMSSLIDYDKRVDEVLISAVGIDSSISAVSKPGMISKSGSDSYYNLIIYLLSLTPDDKKCAEPFNIALQLNFPKLYKEGFRWGYYREIPSRQEEVSTDNRLNEQQA